MGEGFDDTMMAFIPLQSPNRENQWVFRIKGHRGNLRNITAIGNNDKLPFCGLQLRSEQLLLEHRDCDELCCSSQQRAKQCALHVTCRVSQRRGMSTAVKGDNIRD